MHPAIKTIFIRYIISGLYTYVRESKTMSASFMQCFSFSMQSENCGVGGSDCPPTCRLLLPPGSRGVYWPDTGGTDCCVL